MLESIVNSKFPTIIAHLTNISFGTAPPNVPGLNGVNKISEVFFWNTSKVTFNAFFKKEASKPILKVLVFSQDNSEFPNVNPVPVTEELLKPY